jgi:hypothetical protein
VRTEALRGAIHAEPFRPFQLVLADGSTVAVTSPDLIAYGGGQTVAVLQDRERVTILDVPLLARIRLVEDEPARSGSAPS